MTALHHAAARNFRTAAEFLLQKGAKINARDRRDYTPLAMAAASGHTHVAELLLKRGASPDLAASPNPFEEKTPLALAIGAGDRTMAELLRSYGASAVPLATEVDKAEHKAKEAKRELKEAVHKAIAVWVAAGKVNDKFSRDDGTLLHAAAELGSLDDVKTLLKAGADPNRQDAKGQTPLFRAVAGKHVEAVGELVKAKAKLDVKDKQGKTPFDLAAEIDDKTLLKTLRWAAISAASQADMEFWKRMAEQMVKQNVDGTGTPPAMPFSFLSAPTDDQALAAARKQLAAGASVDARDPLGRTLLHLAVMQGHKKTAAFLLDKGANIHAKFMLGTTPLHLAAQFGKKDMAELLLKRGANPQRKNGLGATAADLAQTHGHAAIAELIRTHRR